MNTYTCFCRGIDSEDGTTWIAALTADNIEEARQEAAIQCAADWGCTDEHLQSVECIGVAEGDVKILFWED